MSTESSGTEEGTGEGVGSVGAGVWVIVLLGDGVSVKGGIDVLVMDGTSVSVTEGTVVFVGDIGRIGVSVIDTGGVLVVLTSMLQASKARASAREGNINLRFMSFSLNKMTPAGLSTMPDI
jgi:hypothetical protein